MPLSNVRSKSMPLDSPNAASHESLTQALTLMITLVFSPQPRNVQEQTLALPCGSTVQDALRASSGALAVLPTDVLDTLQVSIWGRAVVLEKQLHDMDRVELCRPLKVDPKVARRERFAKQGARTAGLFAQRRAGAKAGY